MISTLRMMAVGLMFFAVALLPGEAMARPALFVINPIDNQTAPATVTFQYQVRYTVIDEACWAGSTSFDLTSAPARMTITEGGNINWTPSASEVGASYGVVVHASAPTPEGSLCFGNPAQNFETFIITVTAVPPPPPPLSLKMLTWNIQMLPESIAAIDQDKRAALIPTIFTGLGPIPAIRYDVIVFEEAFADHEREAILSRLAAEYPYHTRILGRDHRVVGQDGGVVIVSKWPIEREFQEFIGLDRARCAGSDCFAEKGVMYARLNVNGNPVHVFGTHTQSGDDHRSIRQIQLAIIRSVIESMAIPADQPVLIAGDMNVNLYNAAEYNAMLTILSATHPEPQSGVRGYSSDPANFYVPDNEPPQYLDYVLYSNDHLKPDQAFNDVRIFKRPHECSIHVGPFIVDVTLCDDLSDHYAMEGNFTFSAIGSEPLGTFPFVVFFEGNAATQDFICNVSMKYERLLNFKGTGRCANDEVRSLILYDIPAGRVLRLFDDPDGGRGDDWVEIIAKRDIARKMIPTFERSFEDDDVRVTYYSHNGLDGKVSRLEVDCLGGCNHYPTIIPPPSVLALPWQQGVAFTVHASDVDGDQVEIQANGLPAGATLSPTSGTGSVTATFTWQPGPWDIGEHTVTFLAKDGRGATSVVIVTTITVTGNAGSNQSPAISAPSILRFLSDLQETLAFTVLAVDRDGDQVQILASGLPAGATLSPTSGTGSVRATFAWQPGPADIGEHRITFTAINGHGATSAPAVTTITVTSVCELLKGFKNCADFPRLSK